MSATDELRRLLDERGIKFKAWDGVHPITVWHDEQFSYEYMERSLLDGAKPYTGEVLDGTGFLKAVIHVCTPEQAIAATLGEPEIVRCRDCKHYDPYCTDDGVCFLPDGDGDFARWEVEPDGFCKWGERK